MTRKEWMEKNLPEYISDRADGGVIGCPRSYRELTKIDPSVLTNNPCKGCWNMELNLKRKKGE